LVFIDIEVGGFKERQSSNFVLRTAIPVASIDTQNSRTDCCPIYKRWINCCPYVINTYSDLNQNIEKGEVKCLKICNIYDRQQIAAGTCPCTKYCGNKIGKDYGNYEFA
jgi:hypothetical protein